MVSNAAAVKPTVLSSVCIHKPQKLFRKHKEQYVQCIVCPDVWHHIENHSNLIKHWSHQTVLETFKPCKIWVSLSAVTSLLTSSAAPRGHFDPLTRDFINPQSLFFQQKTVFYVSCDDDSSERSEKELISIRPRLDWRYGPLLKSFDGAGNKLVPSMLPECWCFGFHSIKILFHHNNNKYHDVEPADTCVMCFLEKCSSAWYSLHALTTDSFSVLHYRHMQA